MNYHANEIPNHLKVKTAYVYIKEIMIWLNNTKTSYSNAK